MPRLEDEAKKDIRKRLRQSDGRKWSLYTPEKQGKMVDLYYRIRMVDYQNINFVLRENANARKEFGFLIIGLLLGIFGNVLASLLTKYLPSGSVLCDLGTAAVFIIALIYTGYLINKSFAEDLEEDNVLQRLSDIVDSEEPKLDPKQLED